MSGCRTRCTGTTNTYRNERAVEISIARWSLSGRGNGRVLEVGNVLSHYGVTGHTVIDKYETAPGVINDDIVELLARGESVVLDASWLAEAERALAQELAKRTSSRLVALRCTAPTPVTEARLRTRTGTLSDADPTRRLRH